MQQVVVASSSMLFQRALLSDDLTDLVGTLHGGASPNSKLRTQKGETTVLETACSFGVLRSALAKVDILLQAGADPNAWVKRPPLLYLIDKPDLCLGNAFQDSRNDAKYIDKLAVKMLQKGAKADDENIIRCAIQANLLQTVKFLLEKGQSANVSNDTWGTCLDYARVYHLGEMVELLLQYGAKPRA